MFDVVDLGEVVDEVAACYGMSGGGDEAWVSAPQTGWEWKESHKLGPAHDGGEQTKLKQPAANLLVNCLSQKVIGKKNKETKLQFPFNPGFLTGCVCQLPIVKEMKMWNKKRMPEYPHSC